MLRSHSIAQALALALVPALVLVTLSLTPGQPAAAQHDLDPLIKQVHQSGCREGLEALASRASGTDLEARRALYLAGWCLARLGRHGEAAAAFRAAAVHQSLGPYARVEQAAALLKAGSVAGAAALLREIVPSTPRALKRRAYFLLADAEAAQGRTDQAIATLTAAADAQPDDPAGWLRLGEAAAAAAGRRSLAIQSLARAAWAFPGDPVEPQAREAFARVAGRPIAAADASIDARFDRGRRLQHAGEWSLAGGELRAVVTARATGPVAGEAWYRLGEIWMSSDPRASYDAFRRAAQLGWNPAGAYYWMASTARRLGRAVDARDALAALARVAPSSDWAGQAWLGAGLRAEDDGRVADAAVFYRRVIAAVPQSHDAAEARWRLGWMALRGGRLADAEARFREAAAAAPSRGEAARAWYWVAKTFDARGAGDVPAILGLVADRYPLTFYGQRARARLGLAPAALPPTLPHGTPRETAGPLYEELARLGLDADAAAAAEDALEAKRDLGVVRFAAEVYDRLGAVRQSVAYAEEALGNGIRDEAMWRLAYPRAFWTEVTAAASAANIDPFLLLAVVREESRYDPVVISPARAVGLAQLLPTTAQAMTADPTMSVQRLKDPATNLLLGAKYIRLQLDRFNGDVRLALSAYNAGPGAARRWVGLDADSDYFIEKIGYAETRAYVRRVLGSYGTYRLLW